MSLLDRVLPGEVWDASPLARILPAGAPDPVLAQLAGIPVIGGFAHIPVPGERGLPGSVAGTLDWAQIINRPLIGAYTHVQATPASVWVINHNLDTPPVHISVQDQTGSGLDGYDVQHTSRFQSRLIFSPPAAGMARFS